MKLKEIRVAKGRQQKELAISVGTDEPMMSKFENYKCLPTPPTMNLILKELGCSVEDIYEAARSLLRSARKAEETEEKDERVSTDGGVARRGKRVFQERRIAEMRLSRHHGVGELVLYATETHTSRNFAKRKDLTELGGKQVKSRKGELCSFSNIIAKNL